MLYFCKVKEIEIVEQEIKRSEAYFTQNVNCLNFFSSWYYVCQRMFRLNIKIMMNYPFGQNGE